MPGKYDQPGLTFERYRHPDDAGGWIGCYRDARGDVVGWRDMRGRFVSRAQGEGRDPNKPGDANEGKNETD